MVKLITSNISQEDLETKINEFLKTIPPVRVDVNITITPLHEFYLGTEPRICLQYINYTATVIY